MRSRQSETGNEGLLHSSQNNYVPGVTAKPECEAEPDRGTSTRPTCALEASGTTSYRAIDRDGNLVDSMLSKHRDMEAAKKFFTQAKDVVGHKPACVTTEGHDSYSLRAPYAGYWAVKWSAGLAGI